METQENQTSEETRACINTEDNNLFLSIYSVNSEDRLTGEEETLFLQPDGFGYYKIQSKLYGRVQISYLGNDNGMAYSYQPAIDYGKFCFNRDDLKKFDENRALVEPVEGKKSEEVKEYMYQKIAELEKSGVLVKRLTP